jgi:hypothetical protein
VERLNPSEIEARRAELLARVGMSEEELRARGAAYALTDAQAAVLDELEDLDFLLKA